MSRAAQAEVGVWTRELIDAALDVGGSYYLPYQLHATRAQFQRAYSRATEYFAVKRRVDPTNKFRNKFLDRYGS
jgi:FAD/FMN-containing dehydrogenase